MNFDLPKTLLASLASQPSLTHTRALALLGCIDLTHLDEKADTKVIHDLCYQARCQYGQAAAICIYPSYLDAAQHSPVPIAVVANFPNGDQALAAVIDSITASLASGATEIDLVMPYHHLKAKHNTLLIDFLAACRDACGPHCLKIILETGALQDPARIYQASRLAIDAGANFIKTSTGKIPTGATLAAAYVMLQAIKDSREMVGFKASGGIRTLDAANQYAALTEVMLERPIDASFFRIGASQLFSTLIAHLSCT